MVSSSPHRAAAVAHLAAITIQLWTATGGQEIQYEPPNLSDTTRISQDIGASRGASDCSQTGGARFPKALPSTIPCRHTAGAAQSPPAEPPRWQDRAAAPGTGPALHTPLDATSAAHKYTLDRWSKGTCSSVGPEPPKPTDVSQCLAERAPRAEPGAGAAGSGLLWSPGNRRTHRLS